MKTRCLRPHVLPQICFLFLATLGMKALAQSVTVPPPPITTTPMVTFSTNSDLPTFAQAVFTDLPGGYTVTNGTYNAWCSDFALNLVVSQSGGGNYVENNATYQLYNTYPDSALPTSLPPINNAAFPLVNWLLNHKTGQSGLVSAGVVDIQEAIWFLLEGAYDADPPFTGSFSSPSLATQQLVADAQKYGLNFVPGPNQINAVFLFGVSQPANSGPPQNLIIEVKNPVTPLVVNCSTYPATLEVGVPVNSGPMNVTGGVPPYTYTINTGALPPGLTLNPMTGAVTGTPSAPGSFTILVTDAIGDRATGCAINVVPGLSVTCQSNTSGQVGVPYNSGPMTVVGGVAPYTFSISSGTLPPGLTLNTSNGAITGTPTAPGTFTVQVTDAAGNIGTGCTIKITNPPVLTCSPTGISGLVGSFVTLTPPAASGGTPPYTYSVVGTLPAGLTINSATGVVSGTPTAPGTFNIQVTDATGAKSTATCPYTIGGVPTACGNFNYPYGSAPALTSVVFNEMTVLEAFALGTTSSGVEQLRVWYNDEHAPLLGAREVNGTSYPFSEFSASPTGVYNPTAPIPVGQTSIITGTNPAVDTALMISGYSPVPGGAAGRPLFPAIFLTDLTANGPNSIVGDWQQGDTNAIPPNGIFGTWKGSVITTGTKGEVVTTDSDPQPNNNSGFPDPLPSNALVNGQQYTSEAVWNVAALPGVIPGHTYRAQVIVHDGDQNHSGGDVGEACISGFTIPLAPLSTSAATVTGNVGTPLTASIAASGGVAPYTYSMTGNMPSGLSVNSNTGAISGVPTSMGTNTAMATVKDSAGNSASAMQTFNIGAEQPLAASGCPTGSSYSGSAISIPVPTVTGGMGPYSFSVLGTLPAGLSFNTTTGEITGTPTATGSFSTKVTDSIGNSVNGCSYTIAHPCLLVNLDTAGSFSILGISGGNQNHPQVVLQTSFTGSGTIGAGAGVLLHLQGHTSVSSSTFKDPAATVQIDSGASLTGSQTQQSFTAIDEAAMTASSAFAALSATQTVNQDINQTTTITGNGGKNVISVNGNINLNNGQSLIISGGPNDTFVFNLGKNINLQNGSSIVLSGGVSASQVVFNFEGNGGNAQLQGNSQGIFLNPNGQINIQGGTHTSVFISGNQIQVNNNPTINTVACQ